MNQLAIELNERLTGTTAFDLLSDFGKRFYFPKGIAAQSAEATAKAKRYNATIGMAYLDKQPIMLPSLARLAGDLSPAETVAYAPNAGDAELRDLWAAQIRAKNPALDGVEMSRPTVVPGLTNGLAQLADLFADPDDTIVMPDMFWGNYRLIFEVRKLAKIETFRFYSDAGGFNVAGLSDALSSNAASDKVIVLLNFPNNPTGYSPSTDEVDGIADALSRAAASGKKVLVITDDAYFGLFYEPSIYPHSIFSRVANLHPNIVAAKVDGATKEDFVWGFRIGFVTFAGAGLTSDHLDALERKLLGAIRSSISNSSRPAQSLLKRMIRDGNYAADKSRYFDILKKRYQIVRSIVDKADTSLLDPLPFNSGYFMSFAVREAKAEAIRKKLLDERGIGTIAIQNDYLRIAYSSVDDEYIAPLYDEVFEAASAVING